MSRIVRNLLLRMTLAVLLVTASICAGYLLMVRPSVPHSEPVAATDLHPEPPAVPGVGPAGTVTPLSTNPAAPGPRLVIRRALYGDLPDGPSADVTTQVAQAAQADALNIDAVNDNFGDPAINIHKKLRVDYTFDGRERSKTVAEGETLTISTTGD